MLLVLCLLSTTACLGNSPTSPEPLERQVILAPGQGADLGSQSSVRFVAVIGDSRCPLNALCITGGDAIVRLDIAIRGNRGERDLHTGNMQPVTFDGLRVELVDLSPYPFSGRTIEQSEYRATLKITR